jgi:hypothetical protein
MGAEAAAVIKEAVVRIMVAIKEAEAAMIIVVVVAAIKEVEVVATMVEAAAPIILVEEAATTPMLAVEIPVAALRLRHQ